MKEEKREMNERLDKALLKDNIVFPAEATGSFFSIPTEEDDNNNDFDPYGQLGYGF